VLTWPLSLKYCPSTVLHVMPRFFSPFVSPAFASYWWWYGTVTEGATPGV